MQSQAQIYSLSNWSIFSLYHPWIQLGYTLLSRVLRRWIFWQMGTNILQECPAPIFRLKGYFAIFKMVAEGTNIGNHMKSHPRTP